MKRCVLLMVLAAMVLFSTSALAGPYLNTSAMLLHENAFASRWIRANLGDKQLAANAHKMAQARVDVASKMNVPPEVREAHPHLLLTLAAMERAMEAAAEGQVSNFIRQIQSSAGEAKTFKTVLKSLGFALPDVQRTSLLDHDPRIDAPSRSASLRLWSPRFDSAQAPRRGRWLGSPRATYDPSWLALELDRSAP
jgi:hypothetical protein